MNFVRFLALPVTIAAASLFGVGEAESADVQLYNVRLGPGFRNDVKYQIVGGTKITIKCFTNDVAGNIWYELDDGGFIIANVVSGSVLTKKCGGIGFYVDGVLVTTGGRS